MERNRENGERTIRNERAAAKIQLANGQRDRTKAARLLLTCHCLDVDMSKEYNSVTGRNCLENFALCSL